MFHIYVTVGKQRDLLRKVEDQGVGKNATKAFAISEFYGELPVAQATANQAQQEIYVEVVDIETNRTIAWHRCRPAITQVTK